LFSTAGAKQILKSCTAGAKNMSKSSTVGVKQFSTAGAKIRIRSETLTELRFPPLLKLSGPWPTGRSLEVRAGPQAHWPKPGSPDQSLAHWPKPGSSDGFRTARPSNRSFEIQIWPNATNKTNTIHRRWKHQLPRLPGPSGRGPLPCSLIPTQCTACATL
jgi:hypothetical protein